MECVICKNGSINTGKVSVSLERNNCIVVVKDVSAFVCENCGHYFLSDSVAETVFSLANASIERGVEVEVLRLKQAS